MKSLFLAFAVLFGSTSVHANQCSKPGEIINREFSRMGSETVKQSFSRTGDVSIPTAAVFKGTLTTRTYKVFVEAYCQQTQQSYNEEVCGTIPLENALGRGNPTFKSFYDLSSSSLKRAQLFSNTVMYFKEQPAPERLDFARQLVIHLNKQASTSGIPSSWDKFALAITQAVSDGTIPQSIADEILVVNKDVNLAALGFKAMAGVKITENAGNGTLPKLFNLQLPVSVRTTLIYTTLEGVNEATAARLSGSFISFAANNGIPENWDQFVIMLKSSVESQDMTAEEFALVVETNEGLNRQNLGFEQTATLCKTETRTRPVNVILRSETADTFKTVTKKFQVNVVAGALLPNEKEDYQVEFDGLNNVKFIYGSYYNQYVVSKYSDQNDEINMIVTGTRLQVQPENHMAARIIQQAKNFQLVLQNKNFNALIGGKVFVKVEFYEVIKFWPDSKLGTHTYELTDGNETTINPKLTLKNANNKVRVVVSVQNVGSKYYSNDFSRSIEFKN